MISEQLCCAAGPPRISATMTIRIKRIYEPAAKGDGYRVLVDRLWPRGISKAGAAIELWAPEVAPSTTLRTWFNHEPSRWAEFRTRYHAELIAQADAWTPLVECARAGVLTLVYSARDEAHNQAVALRDFLESRGRGKAVGRSGASRKRPARS